MAEAQLGAEKICNVHKVSSSLMEDSRDMDTSDLKVLR
jgi:hypothetical protein